jgi:hypothetical protein
MEIEHESTEEDLSQNNEKETFETPASVAFMKRQYAKFQGITAKNISDNLWIIGLKWFLKGIMVLILIIMSPFILFVIIFSLLIAG